ncbi:MAG: response regulator [Burkholderiaceae bacterium]|nr:response regulator [Burkholderiaceae bacterium]
MLRFAAVLAGVFVVILLAAKLVGAYVEERNTSRALGAANDHYRLRAAAIEAEWQEAAKAYAEHLGRISVMDDADERTADARFGDFIVSANSVGSTEFTRAVLLGPEENIMARYPARASGGLTTPLLLPQPNAAIAQWVWSQEEDILYRALSLPVSSRGAKARLVLYAPLDSVRVKGMVYPGTRIGILWQGRQVVVADQATQAAVQGRLATQEVSLLAPWGQAPEPQMRVGVRVPLAASVSELAGALAAVLLAVALTAWAILGRWIGRAMLTPMRDISDVAARVAAGDTGARVQASGYGELGEVQRDVNQMFAMQDVAQQALERSEHRYRLLFESMPEGIMVLQRGLVRLANPAAAAMAALPQGDDIDLHKIIHPEDYPVLGMRSRRQLAGEAVTPRIEIRLISRSTRTVWAEMATRVIEWEGQPALLCCLADVTERKQWERQPDAGVSPPSVPPQALPLHEASPAAAAPDAAPAELQPAAGLQAACQVLVVDDEPGLVELASIWLETLGCEVVAVTSAADALAHLKTTRFDVLFTDVVMPGGMDGIELAREAVKLQPAIGVIVASGYSWRDTSELGIPAALLGKPYRKSDLAQALASARQNSKS